MSVNNWILYGSLLACALSASNATAQDTSDAIVLPADFVDEAFLTGFSGTVTSFEFGSDDRLFVAEKSGIVRVVVNGELQNEPFIDISTIVNDRVDRGLLSLALHPLFPEQPFVYLLYTYDPPELAANTPGAPEALDGNGNRVSRLARYTADAGQGFNVAVAGSEEIILGKNSTFAEIGNAADVHDTTTPSCGSVDNPTVDCLPIDEITHTIGALRFATDGSLYVTNGDGASFRAREPITQLTQSLNSLRGKLMRIDADTGLGLSDNPFFDANNPESNRSRVVSYGLRNPYSLALHPVSGTPYVGDVGQEAWEEVNAGAGVNFGWPCYEGGPDGNLEHQAISADESRSGEAESSFADEAYCQELFASNEVITAPLISWPHDGEGNAVVLGDFYSGSAFPSEFEGTLFHADFIKGWLRYADVSDPANIIVNDFATNMQPMTEMRTGTDGALYYANGVVPEIRRIRFDGDLSEGESEGAGNEETGNEGTGNEGTGNEETVSGTNLVSVGGAVGSGFLLIFGGVLGFRIRRCYPK